MVLSGVELVKVVDRQLDLRSFQDLKAHANENVLDFVQGNIHGVPVAEGDRFAGNGHVYRLRFQPQFQFLRAGVQCALQSGADVVGQLAHHRAFLRGEPAHHL